MERQRYRAAWIFPVDGAPLANGVVEIGTAGRIAAVHGDGDSRAIDLGDVAIIPGLVNAHTHLEFSDIAEPLGPREPFTDWIRSVVAHRRDRVGPAIRDGLDESVQSGTTLLGEIVTSNEKALLAGPARVVAFRELIGFRPEQIDEQTRIAVESLDRNPAEGVIPGISPHAPYSVHPQLFAQLVALAIDRRCPLAIHLAETRAELELLADGRGAFVEMLQDFGVWQDDVISQDTRPLDYLQTMSGLERGLVVHGNYLDDEEIDFLAAHQNLTVVYCPRTHAYFGHEPHPWLRMLERGVRVAIGTDSRASNPDLSVWRELCFLHANFPAVDPALLLELGTICGARAVGLTQETGSLAVGKRADLAVVRLTSLDAHDPLSALLRDPEAVVATMCGGTWVHGGWPGLERRQE